MRLLSIHIALTLAIQNDSDETLKISKHLRAGVYTDLGSTQLGKNDATNITCQNVR